MTLNAYVSRFVSDWAGPEAMLRGIEIRRGAAAIPSRPLRFSGEVAGTRGKGGECVVGVAVRAKNELADCATCRGLVSLPFA